MRLAHFNPGARFQVTILGLILAGIFLAGQFWVGTDLPETSRQLFGTVLAADLSRAFIYGLGLLALSGLAIACLRSEGVRWLRGIALALAAAAVYALLAGAVLALNRHLPWPGLPAGVPPLVTLIYSLAILYAGRRYFLPIEAAWGKAFLALVLGTAASAWWPAAGALGTFSELAVAVEEALGLGLLGALEMGLVFYYDQDLPVRRPMAAGLLAAAVFGTLAPGLFAVRGWSAQGVLFGLIAVFFGLAAGALFLIDRPWQVQRAWPVVFAFLFAALLLPLAFTRGAEGDWIPGGLPQAANTAMLVSWITSLGLTVLLFAAWSQLDHWSRRTFFPIVTGAGVLVLLLGTYFTLGHVGLQPETFFVVMADQADTRPIQAMPNLSERKMAVYSLLTRHALVSQAAIRKALDSQGVHYTPYYLVNGLEVEGSASLRSTLSQRLDVARILESPHLRPQPPLRGRLTLAEERPKPAGLPWGILFIKADQVWQRWGITGKGIIVGAMGTGVDWKHPDLIGSYLGSDGNHDYTWYDPWEKTKEPLDTNGIGTHTLATVLGANGIGVAPGAHWIACRSLARDFGNPPLYLACMQFLFAPFPQDGDPFRDGDPGRGAQIVNAAWICPALEGCDANTLSIGIEHLRHAGQMFITGAGNEGPDCGSIPSPGLSSAALTVGSLKQDETLAKFSGRGPVTAYNGVQIKPDLVAPGVGIISALPDGRYAEFNGSSMAASHVTGVVALLWSANPALIGNIDRTEQILAQTAHPGMAQDQCGAGTDARNNLYGYGAVDAFQAVRLALEDR